MARNISKWLRSTMTQSRFSSVTILNCQRVLIIWISRQVNEFVSKHNATLPCCADEISQNQQKELFFSLINNHHNKVHPVMFFRKQQFDPPPTTSVPPLHQAIGNDYDRRIYKKVLPPHSPSPSPSHSPRTKVRIGTPAHY